MTTPLGLPNHAFGGNGGRTVSSGLFNFGPAFSYTPDIFGGTRRLVERQAANAQNQVYQLGAAYLTLRGG